MCTRAPASRARIASRLGDEDAQAGGVLQGTAHDQRIVDTVAVVAEQPHPARTGRHHAHLGELPALQADGDRADRVHVDEADLPPGAVDVVGDRRIVGDGIGVGHREYRGVATPGGRGRPGRNGLGVLPAGLAQVGVQIDEAGQHHCAATLDDLGTGGHREIRADLGNLLADDPDVGLSLAIGPDAAQQHPAHRLAHEPASTLWSPRC
jgi:hypothetical protein